MTAYIYTDASYFPEHNVGSFAFWIDCGAKTIQMAGVLLKARGATQAETMCIANALFIFKEEGFKKVSNVIIITDSIQSMDNFINRKKRQRNATNRTAFSLLNKVRQSNGIKKRIDEHFRHVKAHSGTDTIDKRFNRWCDITARKTGQSYISHVSQNKKYSKMSTEELANKLTFKY